MFAEAGSATLLASPLDAAVLADGGATTLLASRLDAAVLAVRRRTTSHFVRIAILFKSVPAGEAKL